jgi:hypothetical protein
LLIRWYHSGGDRGAAAPLLLTRKGIEPFNREMVIRWHRFHANNVGKEIIFHLQGAG